MKRKLIWLIFLLVLFVSSYYREVLFRSINALMDGQDFFYAKTTALPFLQDWTIGELNQLKYLLTIFFSFWFMSISLLGLRYAFTSKLAYWLLASIYLFMILISIVTISIGIFFLDFQSVYPFLRKLIGVIHNPLPYLFISIGVYGYNQIQKIK